MPDRVTSLAPAPLARGRFLPAPPRPRAGRGAVVSGPRGVRAGLLQRAIAAGEARIAADPTPDDPGHARASAYRRALDDLSAAEGLNRAQAERAHVALGRWLDRRARAAREADERETARDREAARAETEARLIAALIAKWGQGRPGRALNRWRAKEGCPSAGSLPLDRIARAQSDPDVPEELRAKLTRNLAAHRSAVTAARALDPERALAFGELAPTRTPAAPRGLLIVLAKCEHCIATARARRR